ncbi:MAG: c-type cytochrome [Burkholderiales bacterium]|nr:c-type cytochrome [Burkholderiales bacterium]
MRTIFAALALLAAAVAPAFAQGQDALYARSLAATCAGCHGTDGRAVAGSGIVALAGMPAAQITEQLRAFKAGTRPATVMQQIAKGYSDAQIAQLAAYFASQKKGS